MVEALEEGARAARRRIFRRIGGTPHAARTFLEGAADWDGAAWAGGSQRPPYAERRRPAATRIVDLIWWVVVGRGWMWHMERPKILEMMGRAVASL